MKAENGTPYQLNQEQTLKASKALLKHIKSAEKEQAKAAVKKSLVSDDPDTEEDSTSPPIWLTLTTKKHIVDQKRLKPSKITLPHPLNASATTTICLITADPQRTYKDLVASPAFPSTLASRITKVVGVKKIRSKWTQYEAQRKLFAEHDIFVADDRIITRLPKLLGKTFYKSTTKRPIPVSIQAAPAKTDGKKIARAKGEDARGAGKPKDVAAEIEKAISCAIVNLSPSTGTAIRIGYANWTAENLAENIEAVVEALVEKYVPKKWRGVKALHIKGPETAALPIWLADELWVDEEDVLGAEEVKQIEEAKMTKKRKSRALEGGETEEAKKEKKQKLVESNDNKLDEEIKARKEKLRVQKQQAMAEAEVEFGAIPRASRKGEKAKMIAI